ncbi:hypothetical protein FY528_09040 [Hymenobacter lutimineralis]|uniref:Uncharacterized protein n=1 Tax=Hymenobacter lutimineralis TaxID=2606448 RepID=A0A5D6V5S2_9BACT|nr:hypothetical protein [Hymenobacter lutimineralis]TYZ10597.1 hypothetical protein FY528_09040 [Hymenobacter lutimineralis]
MAKTDKAALNMRLDADLLAKAHDLADRRGISLAGLVRMLLIQEIEADAPYKPTGIPESRAEGQSFVPKNK